MLVDMKLEVVVIPVTDVDRAKNFYAGLGWRLDADFPFDNGFRVVQFTPPGAPCSVQFGSNITTAAPGSAQGMYLVVSDIQAACDALKEHGAKPSEVFHPGAPGAQFRAGRVRPGQRPGRRRRQLRLVRDVQRPRRQHLAAAGDHHPAARAGRRGRDVVRVAGGPGGRDAARVGRARRA